MRIASVDTKTILNGVVQYVKDEIPVEGVRRALRGMPIRSLLGNGLLVTTSFAGLVEWTTYRKITGAPIFARAFLRAK